MKTVSINVMNLCVPCENRCRYCLLSYDGKVSGVDYTRSEVYAKRIYDIVKDGYVALHEIKALGGFGKEDKSSFDRAMVELQMGMFITMTGRKQKKNKYGIEYGWNSTVFTTVENFWAERDFVIPKLDAEESYEKVRQQILLLNPTAEEKTIQKFIRG